MPASSMRPKRPARDLMVRFPEVRDGYDRLGMLTAIPKVDEANARSSALFAQRRRARDSRI